MGLFGYSESTFDKERRRLVIPAKLRNSFEDRCVITLGDNGLQIFRPDDWNDICRKKEEEVKNDPNSKFILYRHYANVEIVSIQKQNRIVIPERLLDQFNLEEEIILIGHRDRYEVWNKTDWEDFYNKESKKYFKESHK